MKKIRKWDKEMQECLEFKEIIVFSAPLWYVEHIDRKKHIQWCLAKNLDDESTSNKIHVLRYILNIYVVFRVKALTVGITKIQSAECCEQIIQWINKNIEELTLLEEIEIKSAKIPTKDTTTKKPLTLSDIWLEEADINGNKLNYLKYISLLCGHNLIIDRAFVQEVEGRLFWIKTPQKGWAQYLAAFIYTCLKNNWIAAQSSAPQLVKILSNTFNVQPNDKPFKSIYSAPPKEDYLLPFKHFPSNSKR